MKKIILSIAIILITSSGISAQTILTFYTTMGSFEVELYDTLMPITTGNIKSLVNSKYYDGVIFHRVIDNFVIQGGDPTGTGSGGPGYTIQDEFDSTLSNLNKTLSMANSGPNTGGSQFFINVKNNTFLDFDKSPFTSAHPVFGIVISGWDTVEMIENTPVNGSDRPITDVVMDSVRITQFPLPVDALGNHELQVNIYPNPVISTSIIEVNSGYAELVEVNLYSQNGVLLKNNKKEIQIGVNQFEISELGGANLPMGIYNLTFLYKDEVITKRFVISE